MGIDHSLSDYFNFLIPFSTTPVCRFGHFCRNDKWYILGNVMIDHDLKLLWEMPIQTRL